MSKSTQTNPTPKLTARALQQAQQDIADPIRAESSLRFFKTGKGDYGESDRFLGLTVPQQRGIAKTFSALPLGETQKLLASPWHEHRLTALLILVSQYSKAGSGQQSEMHLAYLKALKEDCINNWDLVDSSAEVLVGAHIASASGSATPAGRKLLRQLAASDHLWSRRVAMIATYYGIKRGAFADAVLLAQTLAQDKHDLMHKAVGWMMREVGKRHLPTLLAFLDEQAATLPRTALRYALEHLSDKQKRHYMGLVKARN